ncbi:hypothetical protein OE88DRAFT_1333738 [Heliocybe sulcata]|uniref:Uncharacterized protein n=1 Tax=Heliocybe sulcata TaxID=5364 RepID=A0A5C3NAM1_9AGAM|nr:hypothetical protein OE88DRAFT_1333738 [Heliocybe sulcata]
MKAFTFITAAVATGSLAAAQQCAICPTNVNVGGVTYFLTAASGGLGALQFCSYNSNPNGGPILSQACWYSGNGALVLGESWANCPATASTGPCPAHSN